MKTESQDGWMVMVNTTQVGGTPISLMVRHEFMPNATRDQAVSRGLAITTNPHSTERGYEVFVYPATRIICPELLKI